MNDTPTATTPFWRFSLTYYGQPGVSDACIALQDGCGVDVNLLLYSSVERFREHGAAKDWLDRQLNGSGPVGLPWAAILGYLRNQ